MQAKRAYLVSPTEDCRQQIVSVLQQLTGSKNLHLSKEIFTKSSMLVLRNYPQTPFLANNPMAGVIGSEKMIVLEKAGSGCFLVLLDERGETLRKLPLPQQCGCKAEGRE